MMEDKKQQIKEAKDESNATQSENKIKVVQKDTASKSLAKITEKEKKKKKVIQTSDLLKITKFYALPILSVLVFLGIVFFAVIPSIQTIFYSFEEIEELQEEDAKLDEKISKLQVLETQSRKNAEIIRVINEIVPTESSEVVNFRQKVLDSAVKFGINPSESQAGETITDSDVQSSDQEPEKSKERLSLIEIPSIFEMNGLLTAFQDWLKDIYVGKDFFVVEEMELQPAPTEENPEAWRGDFNLTKYQFFTEEEFDPISEYASMSIEKLPNSSVIDFLEEHELLELEGENSNSD